MELWKKALSKPELLSYLGDMRQLAGVVPYTFSDGIEQNTRAARLRNAAGLDFSVILDRGMGIGDLSFRGIPLAFMTGAGFVHPGYIEPNGLGWLRSWPGGFLSPCGLTQVGTPCIDDEELGLHGRVGALPARNVRWGEDWQNEQLIIWVEGQITETRMFGEKLTLKRRISINLGEPIISISDEVVNNGFEPAPFMFLQHINLGFPLLSENTKLEYPNGKTTARDDVAAKGINNFHNFSKPVDGYEEQVFYHDLEPDKNGEVTIRVKNPDINNQTLTVTFNYLKKDYPNLVQWKMMRSGNYVLGIEPANCHVEGRCAERERGTLVYLQPGEVSNHQLKISFELN